MSTAKKANRGHLIRAARQGHLWVKCQYHYTDDYAYDAAVNFGKASEFCQVYLQVEHSSPLNDQVEALYASGATHAQVEPLMEKLRLERQQFADEQREKARGKVSLSEYDLRGPCGHCKGTVESGYFTVYSNLSYEYEIR